MYIYTYIHIYIFIYTYIHITIYQYTYIHKYIYVYVYVCINAHIYVKTYSTLFGCSAATHRQGKPQRPLGVRSDCCSSLGRGTTHYCPHTHGSRARQHRSPGQAHAWVTRTRCLSLLRCTHHRHAAPFIAQGLLDYGRGYESRRWRGERIKNNGQGHVMSSSASSTRSMASMKQHRRRRQQFESRIDARLESHTKILGVGSHTKVFDSWCGTRQISENRQQSRRGTDRRIAHSLNSGPGGWRSEPISGLTRPVCKHRDRNLGNHT